MKIKDRVPFLVSVLALIVIVGLVSLGEVSLTGHANAASTVRECFDTDEINNPDFRGKITVKDNLGNEGVYWDQCTINNRKVKQFYCTEDGKFTSFVSICTNSCLDGACIS